MLSHFENESGAAVTDFQGIEDGGKLVFELDVNDGTNNGDDLSISNSCFGGSSSIQVLGSVEAPYKRWGKKSILAHFSTSNIYYKVQSVLRVTDSIAY